MRYTPNYNMIIGEGTDPVNPLTQIFPNFETIDSAMENNKEHGITTASEVTTGSVHAITRVDPSIDVFRFTATSAWTTGDTMTLDGSAVTVHLSDGTAPLSGAYIIGAEVVGVVVGSLVTLLTSSTFDGVKSFNSRNGVVLPQSGDYTANQIGYNNSGSGLSATDAQSAIDEVASATSAHGLYEVWKNATPSAADAGSTINITTDKQIDAFILEFVMSTSNQIIVTPLYICEVDGSGVQCGSFDWRQQGSGYVCEKVYRQCSAATVAGGYDITIANCSTQYVPTYGGTINISTDPTRLIPYRVLALVHNS